MIATPRAAREGLTEAELAIFDLLTRPEPTLTTVQEIGVKKVARELLEKLNELLVFQWRDTQQTRAAVLSGIRVTLNELPEEPYPRSGCGTRRWMLSGFSCSTITDREWRSIRRLLMEEDHSPIAMMVALALGDANGQEPQVCRI